MKRMIWFAFIALMACGGSLSDEQRKKMREQMELHKIKKVTETEITEAAFATGRSIMTLIEKTDESKIDSLARATKTTIHWITAGASNGKEMEDQLIEAYIEGAATGKLEDNIQKIRSAAGDSLLYTKPIVTELPDKSVVLKGTWNITLSQKNLILAMGKK